MWRRAVLAAMAMCIAALAPGQQTKTWTAQPPDLKRYEKSTAEPPANLANEHVVQILRTPNKAQVNRFVCETLPIRNTNPFNIINFFWAVTSREDGGIYSFVNPDGNSGYIVVICPEYQLEPLRKLAAELDRPNQNSAPKSKYIYYRLKHRNVTDPNFLKLAQYYAGTSGILFPDVETNSCLIYDAPEGADGMAKGFDEVLDKPLQQVDLAVNVYEIDVNNDGTLGLDYEAWKNGPGQVLGQFRATGSTLKGAGIKRTHFHASGGGVYLDYPSAYFDALVEKGKAVSLVKTRVAAVNRVPAMLTTDEKVIFYQVANGPNTRTLTGQAINDQVQGVAFPENQNPEYTSSKWNFARTPFDVPSFLKGRSPRVDRTTLPQTQLPINAAIRSVDTGLFLTVVPVVGEGMINMDLDLRLIAHTGYDGSGFPTLNSRQINNSIAVATGDEIIFGGLVRERKLQSAPKTPFLGSLPVVGYLFGKETDSNRKTVVVASVQPVLIENDDNVTPADRATIAKVSGEQVVVLPKSEFCFEQNVPLIH